ncbi:MAG: CDP-diacylglycerol--glycerol-3-phosphate 3-phosphatidyltransferase [Limisphaerales bacterium]|jgi:CDP-diacylglycerol--glycerol-3-phosphate 3-phosphatidyltransferase
MLKKLLQNLVYQLINPLVRLLISFGISPNTLTILGLLGNIISLYFFIKATESLPGYHNLLLAGVFILVGGLFDILDGRVARVSKNTSEAGALFDSVIDRYAELFMFLGLGWYAIHALDYRLLLACFIALSGSLMVSYTRARIEGLGGKSAGGLFQRPERIVLISVALLFLGMAGPNQWFGTSFNYIEKFLEIPIWIVAVGAMSTAIYRLADGYKKLAVK